MREVLALLTTAKDDLNRLYVEIDESEVATVEVGRRLLLNLMLARLADFDEMIDGLERVVKDNLSVSLSVDEV